MTSSESLLEQAFRCFAEFERAWISTHTRQGMAFKKGEGKYTGGKTPLGWRLDEAGNEVPDEEEQRLIELVRYYREAGLSYQNIANLLSDGPLRSRTGRTRFSASVIYRISKAETEEERASRLLKCPKNPRRAQEDL